MSYIISIDKMTGSQPVINDRELDYKVLINPCFCDFYDTRHHGLSIHGTSHGRVWYGMALYQSW